MSFMSKIILSMSFLVLPVPERAQCFVRLSFNSAAQLINDIASDIQKKL